MEQRKRRIVLATVGVFLLVGIASLWTVFFGSSSLHYRMFHDEASFNSVLHRQVKRGDSIEHVEKILGKGRPAPHRETMLRSAVDGHPEGFPDGFQDGDTILEYPLNHADGSRGAHYLQFRYGNLVNFDRQSFANPHPLNLVR